MGNGIQRQPPSHTRRIIAHPVRYLGMSVFMDDHGNEQARKAGDNRKYIKIEHRILLSLIFLLYGIQEKITRCGSWLVGNKRLPIRPGFPGFVGADLVRRPA